MVSKTQNKQVANKQQHNKGITKKPEFKPAQKQQQQQAVKNVQVAKNGNNNKQVIPQKKAPVVPQKGNQQKGKQPVKVHFLLEQIIWQLVVSFAFLSGYESFNTRTTGKKILRKGPNDVILTPPA